MATIAIERISRDELERAVTAALTAVGRTLNDLMEREASGDITVVERDALTEYRQLASLHSLAA